MPNKEYEGEDGAGEEENFSFIPDDLSELNVELIGDDEIDVVDVDLTSDEAGGSDSELIAAVQQRDEFLSALQHLQAEFENYKKRSLRQIAEAGDRAGERLAKQLLPALDVLELALTHAVSESGSEDLAKYLSQVSQALFEVLAKEGLEVLSPQGELFDPNVADAVVHEVGEGQPIVSAVLRAGYAWKGRVIRPAMVKVSGEE
ncbi:MAG: nucleotide exchange factor GrpE [Acidimicrobiaceae bacterium]|nr:nucleotide exchange factor GrpE [Acidimicrobiaceae bacterium]